jgi:hypothetical protein
VKDRRRRSPPAGRCTSEKGRDYMRAQQYPSLLSSHARLRMLQVRSGITVPQLGLSPIWPRSPIR